jgi:hypothetical protein
MVEELSLQKAWGFGVLIDLKRLFLGERMNLDSFS